MPFSRKRRFAREITCQLSVTAKHGYTRNFDRRWKLNLADLLLTRIQNLISSRFGRGAGLNAANLQHRPSPESDTKAKRTLRQALVGVLGTTKALMLLTACLFQVDIHAQQPVRAVYKRKRARAAIQYTSKLG